MNGSTLRSSKSVAMPCLSPQVYANSAAIAVTNSREPAGKEGALAVLYVSPGTPSREDPWASTRGCAAHLNDLLNSWSQTKIVTLC